MNLLRRIGFLASPPTWIDAHLLACAYPKSPSALAELRALGVSIIVNLHARAHDPNTLLEAGLTEVHLPTRDFHPPSMADLQRGVALIAHSIFEGKRVAVHCRAGLGRTGTLAACYLVSQGLDPDAAIHRVRELRPGSIETARQEDAVRAFAHLDRGKTG
jgi:atypical dual specificity phosphatase